MNIGQEVAKAALEIKAIKLRPQDPFTWASGYRMPIYNDNRRFLAFPEHRALVLDGLWDVIAGIEDFDFVAGTSTAGIPWGMAIAKEAAPEAPFTYIRDKPKDHGLKNQIEGLDAEGDYEGKRVLVVEDLISTGGSSVAAVQAVRNANGKCNQVISIFSYGLDEAREMFEGRRPYNKEGLTLSEPCSVCSVLTYDVLIDVARETGYITPEQAELLKEWRAAPTEWGAKHGFPKVEKAK